MKKLNLKGVTAQTWVRTVVLFAALINQALVVFGITQKEIDFSSWESYISYAVTAISAICSWWHNNSFTRSAQNADKQIEG